MKYLIVILLLYPFYASAENTECISQSEVSSLKDKFYAGSTNGYVLKKMATDGLAKKFKYYSYLLNHSSIIKKSTEVTFWWGAPMMSDIPSKISEEFPGENICVWGVSFSLPEKAREMCDDNGAYGYFFNFKKIDGKFHLYSVEDELVVLPDGTLACEKMNDYLE